MGRLQVVMVLYGLFDLVMGLIGTINTPNHEIMSLVGGGGAGILVIGFAALSKTNPRVGFIGAAAIGLLMAGMFASKTLHGIVYPAGIIFTVSLAFVAFLVGAHFAAVNRRKAGES